MDELVANIARAWLTKAMHDLLAAELISSRSDEALDAAIYHCQQCAEKAFKGYLAGQNELIKKTHDLRILVSACQAFDTGMLAFMADADFLNPMAVKYRYPDDPTILDPSRQEFDQALAAARRIYDFVISVLPAEAHPE